MALVNFGPVVSDARKKIGGVVFSKSRTGSFIRRRTSPVQPRSVAVRQIRANFTANSKGWSGTLDDAARQSFANLAALLSKKNRMGNAFKMTGAQLYQSTARNLHTCGLPPLTTAPTDQSVSDLGGLVIAEVTSEASPLTGPGFTVAPANTPGVDDYVVIIAAPPMPAGRAFIGKGAYRQIAVLPPGQWTGSPMTPYDATAEYEKRFGQLVVGQTIHVAIYNVNSDNGAAGRPYPASLTLT
jgi:hypothetical protein